MPTAFEVNSLTSINAYVLITWLEFQFSDKIGGASLNMDPTAMRNVTHSTRYSTELNIS